MGTQYREALAGSVREASLRISMSEEELIRAVTALSEPRSKTLQSPTRPSGRLFEPSIQTRVTRVHTGWLIATFCIVGIGISAAVTIVLARALAEDTGNEDTGIYGEQPSSPASQSPSSGFQPSSHVNQPWLSGFQPRSPVIQPWPSGFQPRSPVTQPWLSGFQPRSPVIQTWPSGFQPRSPVTQPWLSGFQSRSPVIQPWPSGFQPRSPLTQPSLSGFQPRSPANYRWT